MDDYDDDVNDIGGPGQGQGGADPSGKRRRVQRACDSCRKKKVKCDGGSKENPCALCRNNGTECTFQEVAKKRGPPKGYVEQLERRLETMEKLLRSLAPEADLRHLTSGSSKSSVLTEGALLTQTIGSASRPGTNFVGGLGRRVASTSQTPSPAVPADTLPPQDGASPSDSNVSQVEDGPCDMAALAASVSELEIDGRYTGRSSSLDLARTVAAFRNALSPLPANHKESTTWDDMNITKDGIVIKGRTLALAEELLEREELKPENLRLPDEDLARKLIDIYFEKFNPLQPIVHRPSFMRRYDAGDIRTDVQFCGLCLAIFALGSRFLRDDPRVYPDVTTMGSPTKETLQHTAGIYYFQDAGRCIANYLRTPSVIDIQILLLGTQWHFGAANPVGAWTVLGYAVRRALDIGLHRRVSRRHNVTLLEDEMRKRVWFALEWWDMFLSINLGRPLSLSDDDVDIDYPLEVSDEDLDALSACGQWQPPFDASSRPPPPKSGEPTAIAGMVANARLKDIAVKITRTIYTPPPKKHGQDQADIDRWEQRTVAELDSALNKWLDQVPPFLRWSPHLDRQWMPISGIIYQLYYGLQILVHRVFIGPERRGVLNFPSLAICTNAARSCSHVLDTLRIRESLQASYYVSTFSAITVGMVLLIGVYGSGRKIGDLSQSAIEDVQKCIRVLENLKATTYVASHCWAGMLHMSDVMSLDRTAKEAAAMASSSIPAPTQGVKRRQRPDEEEPELNGKSGDSTSAPALSTGSLSPTAAVQPGIVETASAARARTDSGSRNARTNRARQNRSSEGSGSTWSAPVASGVSPTDAQLFNLPFNTNELSASTFHGDATFGTGFLEGNAFMGLGQDAFMMQGSSQSVPSSTQGTGTFGMSGFDFTSNHAPSFDPSILPPFAIPGVQPQYTQQRNGMQMDGMGQGMMSQGHSQQPMTTAAAAHGGMGSEPWSPQTNAMFNGHFDQWLFGNQPSS